MDKPIFVKIDEYQQIRDVVGSINKQMSSVRKKLDELKNIKEKEDQQIQQWDAQLITVEEKLSMINETMQEM
ncbi:hypothetical protein ACFL1B_04840 [Nanoarchaeota archaeon]